MQVLHPFLYSFKIIFTLLKKNRKKDQSSIHWVTPRSPAVVTTGQAELKSKEFDSHLSSG